MTWHVIIGRGGAAEKFVDAKTPDVFYKTPAYGALRGGHDITGKAMMMNGSDARKCGLMAVLAAVALVLWAPRVGAYPSYDDGGSPAQGCVECHYNGSATGGFSGGSSTGVLHLKHLNTFGITSCGLCHMNPSGSDTPVHAYTSAAGFGCAGCHGQDYGETSWISGQPKASGYGLRAAHANAGVTECALCHGSVAIQPETVPPPYYGTAGTNLTDPCSAEQESFDNTVGLDNDGNGLRDMDDPACQARGTATATPVGPTPTSTPVPTPAPVKGKTAIKVRPGESIQAAVDAVGSRGKVYVLPGVYKEDHDGVNAVTVNKDGIRLIGLKRKGQKPVLMPHPDRNQRNGIVVEPGPGASRINGFTIRGFVVKDFPNNGIVVRGVDKFKIEKNETINNNENGIWPILSAEGLVKKNVSYGSEDSAMWVEDAVNVRVVKNVVYDSVTGIEVSNSDDVLLKQNEAYNNTVGIGLYMQPNRHRKESNRWTVVKNYVHHNNMVNSAPPGSMAGDLPPGGGILVLGPDYNLIQDNVIEYNDFFGIALFDYCAAVDGSAFNCIDNPPDFNPSPDYNQVMFNTVKFNGKAPPPWHPAAPLAADLVYYPGDGVGNCYWRNDYGTSDILHIHPWDLPSCY